MEDFEEFLVKSLTLLIVCNHSKQSSIDSSPSVLGINIFSNIRIRKSKFCKLNIWRCGRHSKFYSVNPKEDVILEMQSSMDDVKIYL